MNVYTHAIRAWDRPAAETLSDIIAAGERGIGGGHTTDMSEHRCVT